MIDKGLESETYRSLNQKPWAEGHANLADLIAANRYLTLLFARKQTDAKGEPLNDRAVYFPPEVFREFQRMIKTIVREDRIFVSDRKLVKLYKILRVRAWLFAGGTVNREDLETVGIPGRDGPRNRTPENEGACGCWATNRLVLDRHRYHPAHAEAVGQHAESGRTRRSCPGHGPCPPSLRAV